MIAITIILYIFVIIASDITAIIILVLIALLFIVAIRTSPFVSKKASGNMSRCEFLGGIGIGLTRQWVQECKYPLCHVLQKVFDSWFRSFHFCFISC